MGEFRVHHARFFDYEPLAIQCMSFNEKSQIMALSRSDGSIETWNAREGWYQEEIIPGIEGQSVEALVWQGNRLFKAGLSGDVVELDLVKLQPKRSCSSNAGPIWCLTSNQSGTNLAAGTEDGCVVLFETANDQLDYLRRFESQKSRIMCIAWSPSEDVIVTGGIDNIRLWSATSGRAIQRLTVGRQERNTETVVWCLAVLSDMTIISGDSRGKTTFWNGKQGTVIKCLQCHKADVYCLAVNHSETSVFTSGVDSMVIQFSFIPARGNSDWKDWIPSRVHRLHTHDVRSIQVIRDSVVSGGVDTNLVQFFLKNRSGKQGLSPKQIRAIPHRYLVRVAPERNIVLLQYPGRLEVWRLGNTDSHGSNGDILPLRSGVLKMVDFHTKGGSPVYCCDISKDASLLAYSDCDTVRVYKLQIATVAMETTATPCGNALIDGNILDLESRDLKGHYGIGGKKSRGGCTDNLTDIQPEVNMARVFTDKTSSPDGAHCMCFMGDNSHLVTVTYLSRLQILSIEDRIVSVVHTFPQISDCIHLLALSPDDRWAAVADHKQNVHIYNLQSKQHVSSVPRFCCQATSLTFNPDSTILAMTYTNQLIFEFSLESFEYTDWTKKNSQKFMKKWLKRPWKMSYINYNPSNPNQMMVNDDQMFCIIDKTQPFPSSNEWKKWKDWGAQKKEIKTAFHPCSKYKFLLHAEMLPDNWLLVVERPELELYNSLPDALKKKKFGT